MATRKRFNAFDSDEDVPSNEMKRDRPEPSLQAIEKKAHLPANAQASVQAHFQHSPSAFEDSEEALCSELPPLTQELKPRSFLLRPFVVSKLRDTFAKDHFCVLVAGLSGLGKSHAIQEALRYNLTDIVTELHLDAEDEKPIETLLNLSLSKASTLRKSSTVWIENIDGLDTEDKKRITNFVKKHADKCRLILTCDSLQETPCKSIKDQCTVVSLPPQTLEELQDICVEQARQTFDVHLKTSQVESLCSNARGNPRACLTAFDWSYKTKKAKKSDKAATDIRDVSMDLFSQVPSVIRGHPMKMHLESSDSQFCMMLLFENSSRLECKDHLSSLEISASRFLLDLESTQVSMEAIFRAQHDTPVKFLKMPGPSKEKAVCEAAWWPQDEDRPVARPSGTLAADKLSVIREQISKSGMKTWTSKSPYQHENTDIRELRKKCPFVLLKSS